MPERIGAPPTVQHVALIPAKRHSSRCPDKNWRPFVGDVSLTDYTVESVPPEMFSRVIVSTDNDAYRPALPCEIHRRSDALSRVDSGIEDLIRVLIERYKLQESYVWLLNPTSPFRSHDDFNAIADLIARTSCPAVISVVPVGCFLWKDDRPLFPTTAGRPNTQEAKDNYFVENGMFYVFRASDFLERGTWYLPGAKRFVQHGVRPTVDIDTPEDFQEAQGLALAGGNRFGGDVPAAAGSSPTLETLRNETLAVEALIRPPLDYHVKVLADHFARYTGAMEALGIDAGHCVLDASCGQGYGSYLLAQRAGHVTGVDVSPEYLEVARRHFKRHNLTFESYEHYFAQQRRRADKLVCIETYEHIPADSLPIYLTRVLGALRRGGDAYFTCPLGRDGPSAVNEFHLNEPRLGTLHAQLALRFRRTSYQVARREDSFGQVGEYCCAALFGYLGEDG